MNMAPGTLQGIENKALAHFKKVDPLLYKAILPFHGSITNRVRIKRTNAALFESLAGSVVSQQLSTKAAASILARVKIACGGKIQPAALRILTAETLRGAGLSAAKIQTLQGLTNEVLSSRLTLLSLKKLQSDEAVKKLVALWGIGPWTAEMFLMFSLGAPDIFSPGDLILARAVEELYGLPKGSDRAIVEEITRRWSPYRTYASLFLWQRNDMVKNRTTA
jgi:DNA-3-methyladenine glycosylase II